MKSQTNQIHTHTDGTNLDNQRCRCAQCGIVVLHTKQFQFSATKTGELICASCVAKAREQAGLFTETEIEKSRLAANKPTLNP